MLQSGEHLTQLHLLRGFVLVASGTPVKLPPSAERLIAFLAVTDRPVSRPHVAGCLWPDTSEERASGSLRSLLWRLPKLCAERLVEISATQLRLSSAVCVDYPGAAQRATSLISGRPVRSDEAEAVLVQLGDDLLPDWYDEWVLAHRERFHQSRLQALEVLSDHLLEDGHVRLALEAAVTAIAAEPLRESSHRQVIRIHLGNGNESAAVREYLQFREMLHDELGLVPTPAMEALMEPLRRGSAEGDRDRRDRGRSPLSETA